MYLSKIKSEKTAGDRVAIIAFSGSLLLTWSVSSRKDPTLFPIRTSTLWADAECS